MKVAVVSIMKNEAAHVERWAKSCEDATYRYLLDTGSTDDSVALAEKCGVTVLHGKIDPWRFDRARNHLLDLLPDDVDWIINLDVDEVLGDDWYEQLERVPNDGSVNRPRYLYTWNWEQFVMDGQDVDIAGTIARGKPGLQYQGDKITRRFTHRWKGACHEVNITEPGNQELQAQCGLRIYHFADNTKSRGGYLDLLVLDVEEDPTNARNTYYLGREFMYRGMTDKSIAMLKHHLSLETAWWKPERGYACRYIARQVPDHEKHEWLMKAVGEYSSGRECWIDLAQWAHDRALWQDCYHAASKAVAITSRGDLYLTEAQAWGWKPHDLMALAAHRLGYHDIAIQQGAVALEHAPEDKRLRDNLFFYKNAKSKVTVVIPTKSNVSGLTRVVAQCMKSNKVGKIVVIGDGEPGWQTMKALPNSVTKMMVPEGVGIHVMWNLGMSLAQGHVLFLNDDVSLDAGAIDTMCASLDKNPAYGLVCPMYWETDLVGAHAQWTPQEDVITETTCRGRYDGTGGMAGFCMMLAEDLVKDWRFDERMVWYWGDDDLLGEVVMKGRLGAIIYNARCHHDHSVTIHGDTPKNFATSIENDRKIYEGKRNAR